MHFSTSLLGATAVAALMISSAQAQDLPPAGVAPPQTGDKVNILYSNDGNGEIGTEDVPFNNCYASELAFGKYSYLTFAPSNATINFYKDSNCQDFTFGLDGYYGGYPGPARSFKWVGWNDDFKGEFFNKDPIQGQGDAATGGETQGPPGGKNPGGGTTVPAPTTDTEKEQTGGSTTGDSTSGSTSGSTTSTSSSTFFGGVVGSLIVLGVGGVIFWKTAGKKLVEDKGKGVLPYNRVGRDGDILLTTNNRGRNSFEIGDEDDDEEDEVESRRQPRSGRQERYHDDDQV
ncbi:hypothetical protein EDD21DRAFT_370970 [Dissophora ornata]|nr:hypothetical protein BGZ58_010202 [Dissophora ornata]KAI8602742.1 hypothetical protein EDD21DRAFT_370970 [Dissophora ornata]